MRPMEANFARMTAWSSSVLRSADTDGTMAAWVLHLSLREAGCTGADPGQVRLRYRMSCPIIDEAAPPKKIGSCQYRRPSKRKVPSPHPDYPPWPAARRGQRQHPHRARLRPHRPHRPASAGCRHRHQRNPRQPARPGYSASPATTSPAVCQSGRSPAATTSTAAWSARHSPTPPGRRRANGEPGQHPLSAPSRMSWTSWPTNPSPSGKSGPP